MLLRPLGQAAALTIPMRLRPVSSVIDVFGLALCAAAMVSRKWRAVDLVEGPLRVAAGLLLAATASGLTLSTGSFTSGLGFLLAPLAWLAALAPRGIESPAALTVARRLLPPLAVLQTLVAYPVAGFTQVQLSSFLLIPLGAIVVADGARQLARAAGRPRDAGWPRRLAAAAAVLLPLAITLRGVLLQMQGERALYESNVPLGLPGATRLRIPAAEARPLRALVAELRQRCSTHIGLPERPEPLPVGGAGAADRREQQHLDVPLRGAAAGPDRGPPARDRPAVRGALRRAGRGLHPRSPPPAGPARGLFRGCVRRPRRSTGRSRSW